MSDLEICRICLRTGCKMYRYNSFKLKGYYEDIMAAKVTLPDGLPSCFCYECAALLYKFHKFKIKCYNGQNTLKARLATAGLISYAAIRKIDRKRLNLITLAVLEASERVKTFIENDSTCIASDTESLDDEELDKNCDTETLDTELVKVEDKSSREVVFHEENSFESQANYNPGDDANCEYVFEENTTEDTTKALYKEQPNEIEKVTGKESKKSFDDIGTDSMKLRQLLQDAKDRDTVKKKKKKNAANDEHGLKKINKEKYAKQRIQVLDDSLWKHYFLSEEDAWKEFRALAEDPKYVAAEYKCSKCYTWFRTRNKLERHHVLRHGSRGSLECQFCAIRFKFPCDVRKHLQKHYKRFKCLKCGLKTCDENSAFLHQDMHSGARRSCNYCGKSFKHSSTYYTHLRTHRSNFVCSMCGESFVSETGLEMHKKRKHCTQDGEDEKSDDGDTSDTYCTKCSIQFESRKAYTEHVFQSAAHDEADETKADRVSVKTRHIASRKRKRPTTCHQCGQAFETQQACIKHHRKEHPNTPYFDPTDRFICDICGANLAKGSILTHQNMHTREKMHTCDTCGRSFSQHSALKIHSVTHTGEKKHKCPLCDKRFTQKGSMQLHYKTFHLKQPYPKRNRNRKANEPKDSAMGIASCSADCPYAQ